jgi:hypothetical protein
MLANYLFLRLFAISSVITKQFLLQLAVQDRSTELLRASDEASQRRSWQLQYVFLMP